MKSAIGGETAASCGPGSTCPSIATPTGQSQHFISVIEDITERRTLEAQVRQANKMDAIGRLASGVAHDFNNLLTVILGFAELVTADGAMANQHGKDLGEIIKAAQRATGLTKQLLAFSRQQVLHAAPLDVNGLITEMTGMLGRLIGEHIEVALALAPNLSAGARGSRPAGAGRDEPRGQRAETPCPAAGA